MKNKKVKIIALVLVIVLLVLAFLLIRKLSNNFTTDIKTFYLIIENDILTENQSNLEIMNKTIKVHSVGENVKGQKGFSWRITRNRSENFYFTVNEEEHSLSEIEDYSQGFEVVSDQTNITIRATNILQILARIYSDERIEITEDFDDSICYFSLVIISFDGSKSIVIDFPCSSVSVEMDSTVLVF